MGGGEVRANEGQVTSTTPKQPTSSLYISRSKRKLPHMFNEIYPFIKILLFQVFATNFWGKRKHRWRVICLRQTSKVWSLRFLKSQSVKQPILPVSSFRFTPLSLDAFICNFLCVIANFFSFFNDLWDMHC